MCTLEATDDESTLYAGNFVPLALCSGFPRMLSRSLPSYSLPLHRAASAPLNDHQLKGAGSAPDSSPSFPITCSSTMRGRHVLKQVVQVLKHVPCDGHGQRFLKQLRLERKTHRRGEARGRSLRCLHRET